MRRIAGITLGLAILVAPTSSAAQASEQLTFTSITGYEYELIATPVASGTPLASDVTADVAAELNGAEAVGQAFVTTAWTMSGLVGLVGLCFVPKVVTRTRSRRRSTKENQSEMARIEASFECSLATVDKDYAKLLERVGKETDKYGKTALEPAVSREESARVTIESAKTLRDTLPTKKRSLEDSTTRLRAVLSVKHSIAQAEHFITEANSCIDYVIACEKSRNDEALAIEAKIENMKLLSEKMELEYKKLQASFDEDYIAGVKSEITLMNRHLDSAEESLGNLKTWLAQHNLEMAAKSAEFANACLGEAVGSYRAFKSRVMAISSFDLSRDAEISGVLTDLDANIPENRAEGMARIIGDARIAVKNIRRLDTKSGNPEKALEELMVPVKVYRNAITSLQRKKASTEKMKQSVFAAMDEAVNNKKTLLSDLAQYRIIPTAEERSSLERIDAVLIHNFAKIRFDVATLNLFDVEKTAVWSGNALKTIMTAQTQASSLKARVAEAKAKEKAEQDEAERRKKKKKKEEEERRRKRRRSSSSSSYGSGSSYSYSD